MPEIVTSRYAAPMALATRCARSAERRDLASTNPARQPRARANGRKAVCVPPPRENPAQRASSTAQPTTTSIATRIASVDQPS